MLKLPAAPAAASPVEKINDPEEPLDVVPLYIEIAPLMPVLPPFAECTLIWPLEVDTPFPVTKDITDPVKELLPPPTCINPLI
jgi:hypothetical protein